MAAASPRDPFSRSSARFEAGKMGMWLFLLTLGILFAATLLGYLVVRLRGGELWRAAGVPAPPWPMAVSTVALLASSWTLWRASRAVRQDDRHGVGVWVGRTLVLAVLFLLVQGVAWTLFWREGVRITDGLYAWTFYVLTGLHALHVIGGLVSLSMVASRSRRGAYSRLDHAGLTYCAMYWHFLDAVWIVLYGTILVGSLA